jgi:preprotein translocase subunit SecA
VVQNGEVIIVDDFTGRLMPGRRYSDGLHEAIEAKQGVSVKRETVTVATITLQNYFRLYRKLGGMTGTALTDAEEFDEIYGLGVTPLPTNVQHIVDSGSMGLLTESEKIEGSESIRYVDPNTEEPVFFKRIDFKDQIYSTEPAKDQAIVEEVKRVHEHGRPILVGTTSVEHSETIHRLLTKANIRHNVLNAKIHQSEALLVAQAGQKGAVTISTNMAGRGTDILLGGNSEGLSAENVSSTMFDQRLLTQLAQRLLADGRQAATEFARRNKKLSEDLVDWLEESDDKIQDALPEIERVGMSRYITRVLYESYELDYNAAERLVLAIQAGALQHSRETLADLGKDVAFVDHVLRELNTFQSYASVLQNRQATSQQKSKILSEVLGQLLFEQHYNARAALIRAVLADDEEAAAKVVEDTPGMDVDYIRQNRKIKLDAEEAREEIWKLGGLHVVGSERHESRRIDNQLRGRAARQGDPGSSRFFLSLEDDLMRRFGGERLQSFMSRTNMPDDMPIENSMLDRIIENSQERIEGYNFDIRKNVVEYDDVMSKQRQAIYGERRAILIGEATDLDGEISEAFDKSIEELVSNYVIDYPGYVRGEVDRIIAQFSTDATDALNLTGVLRQLRGLLPGIVNLDREELAGLSANDLAERLMILAYENEEQGDNLYQLLLSMGRVLPILPAIPNLGVLARNRSGQMQAKDKWRREYIDHVDELYNNFLAEQIATAERERIWTEAKAKLDQAFSQFRTEGLTVKTAEPRQSKFRQQVDKALRDLLLDSLSALDGEQLITALNAYVERQQSQWRTRIGDDEYRNFQRSLLLSAIDNEWRDYLTAMDDLRREIGLTALGQRDPKVEYKRRSYEMFTDMRGNIDKDIGDRFFRQIANHVAFVERQQAEVAYKLQAQSAGYQVVSHESGRSGVRRATVKVGRNDPCPCGSGKKYKHCHGRSDKASSGKPYNGQQGQAAPAASTPSRTVRRTKKKKRRRR